MDGGSNQGIIRSNELPWEEETTAYLRKSYIAQLNTLNFWNCRINSVTNLDRNCNVVFNSRTDRMRKVTTFLSGLSKF